MARQYLMNGAFYLSHWVICVIDRVPQSSKGTLYMNWSSGFISSVLAAFLENPDFLNNLANPDR
eukprot:15367033-Ditylum_brightwellii.AAC.1